MAAAVRVLHALNRVAFGPRPGDVERVTDLTVERYLDEQLHPDPAALPEGLRRRLDSLGTLRLDPVTLFEMYERPVIQARGNPDAQRAARRQGHVVLQDAVQARLLRALDSPWQLHEVMTAFWFNHFNVFAGKGVDRLWVGHYEEHAIRPHALGRFRTLLGATAKHPAMLFYLDNWRSSGGGLAGARRGLNENYARELMELHTLGVDGGYAQRDVTELARVLTGWGLVPRMMARRSPAPASSSSAPPGFFFDARRHDRGDKVLLAETIREAGMAEGEHALDVLSAHPSTARFIASKLAQAFVADRPPDTLVARLAGRFVTTQGDIAAVLKALFTADEFWDERAARTKFRTPYDYVISAVRATGTDVRNVAPLAGTMAQLGMPLYGCPTPDGYKATRDAWLTPEAMIRRLAFATALGTGRLPLGRVPDASAGEAREPAPPPAVADAARLTATLGGALRPATAAAVAAAPPALRAAVILGSPEVMLR